jgi:hypothetical protein
VVAAWLIAKIAGIAKLKIANPISFPPKLPCFNQAAFTTALQLSLLAISAILAILLGSTRLPLRATE